MMRAVIGIVIVSTFVGVAMPGRPKAEAEGKAPAPAAEPWFASDGGASSVANSSASATSSEVRLTRRADGHFYADVQVNGTVVEFMIDTGATSIAMTPEDARRVGIDLSDSQKTYVGEGAGGALSGQIVSLDRVRLGSKSSTDMRAAVIEGAGTNLLGQSFLTQFEEVTVRGDVMTLR
jgi:aspartyl protease family protein